MFYDKNEINNYTIDFGSTKVIWLHYIPFIVPEELTLTEERYLLASQQTLFCGNTSVDNILKTQFPEYEERQNKALNGIYPITLQKNTLLNETLKDAKTQYESVFKRLKGIDFSCGTESSFVCEIGFIRMQSSINACRFLIKYGYYFETYAIQRQILEQLAFMYHVSNNNIYEEFNDPTKCIKEFKTFYPKAGEIYGMLCNRTHIDKSQIKYYLQSTESDKTNIVYNSLDYSLETLFDFLKILDLYCCTFKYCFRKFNKRFSSITQKYQLKKNRQSRLLVESYRLEYKKLLENLLKASLK